MRKLVLGAALLATVLPSAALAQSYGEIRHDRQVLRHDRQELRRDQRDARRHVAYVAPYRGWAFRPVRVGHQLRPAFFGSRYYVTNYGAYHVRAPGRYQRWIRYGDDLVLVNVRTGRVLEVIQNRFW